MAVYREKLKELGVPDREDDLFIEQGLFSTITNGAWDNDRFVAKIREGLKRRKILRDKFLAAYQEKNGRNFEGTLPDAAVWFADDENSFAEKAKSIGVLATEKRGCPFPARAADHRDQRRGRVCRSCLVLGFHRDDIDDFISEALASTTQNLSVNEMIAL
jgi:hydroxylamine reductase